MIKLGLAISVLMAASTVFAQTPVATMPKAVPLYPGSTIVEKNFETDGDIDVTLRTSDSVAQVRAFYEKSIRAAGVEPSTRSLFANSAKIRGKSQDNRYEVEIEQERNITEIDIEVDRRFMR